ncbi:hypothetical protein MPSEU_000672700 [Mayamaea pseudoterrestris]|nr:hypothetical protein MPSEU_000672700 [Mayamaea pseudoterrestris]
MTSHDCIVCGETLSASDLAILLPCVTADCHACMCGCCLQGLHASAKDDYQTASDGSRQLKTKLQCPMCRNKYHVLMSDNGNGGDSKKNTTLTRLTGHEVVLSVLILRQAHVIAQKMTANGNSSVIMDVSAWNSSDLTKKDLFCKQYSWAHLTECYDNYVLYEQSLGAVKQQQVHASTATLLQTLEPLKPFLQGSSDETVHDFAISPSSSHMRRPLTDPTLFCGLDELLTLDEQDFCSQLLVSNDLSKIHQACLILQGMLQVTRLPQSTASNTTNHRPVTTISQKQRQYKNLDQMRKRYPLPKHMPRCVRLMLQSSADCLQNPKHFVKHKSNNQHTLELKVVRGLAGHVGLRKGDLVTHVEGELVESFEQLQVLLQENLRASYDGGVLIGVNICEATAKQLMERNEQMKSDKVRFEYNN